MGVSEAPVAVEKHIQIKGVNNPTYSVIVGFSSRALLESLKNFHTQAGKPKNIEHTLIIEPSLERFHALIKREYIGDIVNNPDYDLIVGIPPNELLAPVQKTMAKNEGKNLAAMAMKPEIVVDPFAYPFDATGKPSPEAQEVISQVQYASNQITLSMGCSSDSFNRWEQMVPNEKNMQDGFKIKELFNEFDNVPTVVLGAGPSLKSFIDAYKKYDLEDKVFIIAADAALKLLVDNGVRPHVITRCERKYTNIFRGVTNEHTKGVYFAGYPWVDHRFFELFSNRFMLFRSNGVCRWTTYDPGFVDGGVSAANAALEIAFKAKSSPIILSGIDLCFIGNRSHIEGTEVEFDVERSKDKWQQIKGNNGGMVTSIPTWVRCLGEYQLALFKHEAKGKVYNTSLDGAFIEGTVVKPWSEVAPMLTKKLNLWDKLKKLEKTHNQEDLARYQKTKQDTLTDLKKMLSDLNQVFFDLDDSFTIARKEEEKAIKQLSCIKDTEKYWINVAGIQPNLANVYSFAAAQVDAFKAKWYPTDVFTKTLGDITQLDLFQNELRCSSLKNVTDWTHMRMRQYIEFHMNYFTTVKHYIEELLEVLK